jgi:hypothetical protein
MVEMKNFVETTPTQRVVARLYAEGWFDCPNLGFPALSQYPIADITTFILMQLRTAGGQMRYIDLQLATLIFAIPAHEFQFHPYLQLALNQLVADGLVRYATVHCETSAQREEEMTIVLVPHSMLN